jgi:hypothetical protein
MVPEDGQIKNTTTYSVALKKETRQGESPECLIDSSCRLSQGSKFRATSDSSLVRKQTLKTQP